MDSGRQMILERIRNAHALKSAMDRNDSDTSYDAISRSYRRDGSLHMNRSTSSCSSTA